MDDSVCFPALVRMITKDSTVTLTERGLKWMMSGSGVPARRHANWTGRIGVVSRIYRNKLFCLVHWEGNKGVSEPVPVAFLQAAAVK